MSQATLKSDPPASEPAVGSLWRHRAGDVYRVLTDATDESTRRPVVVYEAVGDGRRWARSRAEFLDGRFERLPQTVLPPLDAKPVLPPDPTTFDPADPDLLLVRQVLFQAFEGGAEIGPVDLWASAWCLREWRSAEYAKLEGFLLHRGLIRESSEDGYHKITQAGLDFEAGGGLEDE